MTRPSLRVATAEDAPVAPKTITEAAAANDQVGLLEALRTRLAKACQDEGTPPRDLAALSRRLIEVDRDIKSMRLRQEEEARSKSVPTTKASGRFDASAI